MVETSLTFGAVAAAVALIGIVLARSADRLGSALKLERSITGFVMLAAATSLPELIVSCQVARTGAVDMAVGSILGSCLMNLLILAAIDLSRRSRRGMLSRQAAAHALASLSSILLAALVATGALLPNMPTLGRIHSMSVILCIGYALTFRMVFVDRATNMSVDSEDESIKKPASPKGPLLVYVAAAGGILLLSPILASTSNDLAAFLQLSGTFFGAVFLAFVTSLPEVVTTHEASRMKADDMAIGNILGSNAFNLLILVAVDISYSGPLFTALSAGHAIAALGIIITTTIATMGLLYRVEKRIWYLEPHAVGVIGFAILFFYLLYLN